MTLQEIKDSVEHCKAVFCETGDPCYHCGQKEWLIKELEKALNPAKVLVVPAMSPEEEERAKKILSEISNHTSIYIPLEVAPVPLEVGVDLPNDRPAGTVPMMVNGREIQVQNKSGAGEAPIHHDCEDCNSGEH